MDITGWFLSQVRPSVVLETITGWVFGWFERQWPAHQWRWRMERPKTLQINVWSTIFQVWLKFQGWKVYFNSKKTQRIWNVTKTSASEMPITCNPDGVLAFRKEWGRNEMKWNDSSFLLSTVSRDQISEPAKLCYDLSHRQGSLKNVEAPFCESCIADSESCRRG
jgi:hypothetical protein